MAIWWLLIKIKNPESSTESRFKMVGRGRRLARSRLTGLRIFFSQAALAPKKTPSPSAHSRFAPGKACALQVLVKEHFKCKRVTPQMRNLVYLTKIIIRHQLILIKLLIVHYYFLYY